MLNGLDLFSGIGGMSLALKEWVRPVAYCEIEPYCQSVLLQRMQEGNMPKAPIWDDIQTLSSGELPPIDIVYGGFPCQGISVAGHGKGLADKRSGLFYEILRLAKEIKPKFIFLENVPAICSRGGVEVVTEIAKMGFDARWCCISAASVGALHRRERWFLLGYTKHARSYGIEERRSPEKTVLNNTKGKNEASKSAGTGACEMLPPEFIPNATGLGQDGLSIGKKKIQPKLRVCGKYETVDEWREALSKIRRTTDGVSHRVDRIKSLGNAVVPCQAKEAFKILMGI